jgi:hypothetical protein
MKRILLFTPMIILVIAQIAWGHDPRVLAKKFTHSFSIEGAGKLTLSYTSLHWNQPSYDAVKKNDQQLQRMNSTLWRKIGTLDTEFDVVIGGVPVPKGSYNLGINFDANDNFKLVLWTQGGKDLLIPLQTQADGPLVTYLTFDLRPVSETDTFIIEGRSGKFRSSAEVKVPYLTPHEHPEAGQTKSNM